MSNIHRPSAADVTARILRAQYSPEVIQHKVSTIHEHLRRLSPRIQEGNFTRIAPDDLHALFDLYDEHFFSGDLHKLLDANSVPLRFTLSSRMTRSAGLTKRFAPRQRRGTAPAPASRYEISLSTHLLFSTFDDIERIVRVNGLVCKDRLQAAQRIFEHEIIHLLEMLIWGQSSCSAERFRTLVWNLFAHPETRHDLVTQQERARAVFDIRVGDRVAFEFEGRPLLGIVNRITRRATVLVESLTGERYADGKRYQKYYIPLSQLRKADRSIPT